MNHLTQFGKVTFVFGIANLLLGILLWFDLLLFHDGELFKVTFVTIGITLIFASFLYKKNNT